MSLVEIFLDKDEYLSGDTVNGRVEIKQSERVRINGIYLRALEEAQIKWSNQRRCYDFYEKYFDIKLTLLAEKTNEKIIYTPGLYAYDFSFNLPSVLPSTAKRSLGSINGLIEVYIEKSLSCLQKSVKDFKILNRVEINDMNVDLNANLNITRVRNLGFAHFKSGSLTIDLTTKQGAYTIGEDIDVIVSIKNDSSHVLNEISVALFEQVAYGSASIRKYSFNKMAEQNYDNSIAPQKTESWMAKLKIPTDCVTSSSIGREANIISIDYFITLPRFFKNQIHEQQLRLPVFIGSVRN